MVVSLNSTIPVCAKEMLQSLVRNPHGKVSFGVCSPVVPLTDDIKGGNLRQMKPSIHVVRDQFQRFQSKNVIETTKRQKRGGHRGNYKYFLRPGCKMQTLEEANEHSRENSKHSKYTKTKLLAKQ